MCAASLIVPWSSALRSTGGPSVATTDMTHLPRNDLACSGSGALGRCASSLDLRAAEADLRALDFSMLGCPLAFRLGTSGLATS